MRLQLLWGIGCVLAGAVAWAQKKEPVSLSYQNIVDCFPELRDEQISFKVDLKKLKELSDRSFVTIRNERQERRWEYIDSEGRSMVMIYRVNYRPSGKKSGNLSLFQRDRKGVLTEIELTGSQRNNPSQDVINNFLLGAKIELDQRLLIDSKLQGVKMTYLRRGDRILELQLESSSPKRSLACDSPEPPAIICTCAK